MLGSVGRQAKPTPGSARMRRGTPPAGSILRRKWETRTRSASVSATYSGPHTAGDDHDDRRAAAHTPPGEEDRPRQQRLATQPRGSAATNRRTAMRHHIASTTPKGQAPDRKP